MKRFDRTVLRRYASAAVILLAVLAWPSAGWSRTARHACDVDTLLDRWVTALRASSPTNPAPVVGTYAVNAVLLPTCENGPLTGGDIKGYFVNFLGYTPSVAINTRAISGDCANGFASGLYTFKLKVNGADKTLYARYTYIFRRGLITQHHSSLEPKPRPVAPGDGCPAH
jgi:hypothetical protein